MHRSSSPSIDRVVKRIQSPANEVLDLELTADAIVTACTPAHTQRGFCEGDIIVSIDESFVSDRAELRGILITGKLDRVVNVTLHRQPDTDGLIGLMPLSPGARSPARKSSPEPAPLSLRSANATNTPSTEPGYDFRRKLSDKLRLVSDPSRCIVLVCDHGLNPVEQIAILALELQRPALETLTCLPTKTKARIASQDDVIEKFRRAMRTGAWLVVTKSDKSITVLSWISQLVEELREHRLAGIDRNARIILCTEPHPHFPTPLLDGATSMRVHTSSNISTLELTSVSRSNALRKYLLDATSVGPAAQASVKLNSFVSIVDIPTRDVHSRREQPVAFTPGNQSAVRLVAAVQGFANEQFYTASAAGLPGQYAIGSSLGNVFLMDHEGAALISFHAHSSAVWDISFRGQLDLVTGGEDGHGVWWTRDPAQPDSLICSDVVRQANDVYAVRHTSSGRAVGLGGYLPHVLIRSALPGQAATSHPVLMTTAVQSMSNLEGSEWLLCGGSDGSVCTIDAATGTILSNAQRHTKKCPCIATSGANMGVSGSLDGTIKLWDVREDVANSNQVIKFKFPVMGLAVSGHYLAGCVGESLHIWDVRNVEEPLGTIARAWKGTSRGVVIDAATETVVTASPDGFVRFWSFAT